MSYYSDIRLMVLDLRVGRVIDHMHRVSSNNQNDIITNIINESIYKMRNLNNNLENLCKQYKKYSDHEEIYYINSYR